MSDSVLIPMSVAATYVAAPTPVPGLRPGLDGAFELGPDLAAGVHVHWALPDALTRAQTSRDGGGAAFFPGVPDRWLVVRFDRPDTKHGAPRTWRAWVVDSAAEVAVPLKDLAKLEPVDDAVIHTAAGMLRSAAPLGRPGWGVWDADTLAGDPALQRFDPLTIAYYPSCAGRLGFHDPLEGLAHVGSVAYTVVGWYSTLARDPLHASSNRADLLNGWKLAFTGDRCEYVPTPGWKGGSGSGSGASSAGWRPGIEVSESRVEPMLASAARRAADQGGSLLERVAELEAMQTCFPIGSTGELPSAGAATKTRGPCEIRCHGSVFEVALGAPVAVADIGQDDVRLYASAQRATAEIAGNEEIVKEDAQFVEMMLQDLGSQSGTLSGVIDLPGAAHAATFNGTAGASTHFACVEILRPAEPLVFAFDVPDTFELLGPSGHWPPLQRRSASSPQDMRPSNEKLWRSATADLEFTADMGEDFAEQLISAVRKLPDSPAVDPRLVYVRDLRADAQPSALGELSPAARSDGAAYWLDLAVPDDVLALARACHGAEIRFPETATIHEVPGPRWYRPGSPQLVLLGTGRSFRFGEDGGLDEEGFLKTRASGGTLIELLVGSFPWIYAPDLLATQEGLVANPGLPAEGWGLIVEALLLDPQSASAMTALAAEPGWSDGEREAARLAYEAAILGGWFSRDADLSEEEADELAEMWPSERMPSPIAIGHGQDPPAPLFVDVRYAHPHDNLAEDWQLEEGHVDLTPAGPAAPGPSRPLVRLFDERCLVTATVAHVLESVLLTRQTTDFEGHMIPGVKPPPGIDDDTFLKLDVISAALTGFDAQLLEAADSDGVESEALRERSGALRVNELDLVDVFGGRRHWTSTPPPDDMSFDPRSVDFGAGEHFWTPLAPRLPYWARLSFRFLPAGLDPEPGDATQFVPPICGLLVPDFVDHALEVFDAQGKAIGQLTTDRIEFTDAIEPGDLLEVHFDLHPWVELEPGQTDPLDAIEDPSLHDLVAAIVQQSQELHGQPEKAHKTDPDVNPLLGNETGLSALLRVIDTIRGGLDPDVRSDEVKVRLMGEPIVVLRARLSLEAALGAAPAAVREDPVAPMGSSPPLPAIRVRIGDLTRTDDGVLGCFVQVAEGEKDPLPRFAPVSRQAAELAVLNRLMGSHAISPTETVPAVHPFVFDQVSEFTLRVNAGKPLDLVILADPRGGLYATSGVLPRKKITIPGEYLKTATRDLDPTFRIGPILTFRDGDAVQPILPAPDVVGLRSDFVHRVQADGGAPVFAHAEIAPVLPMAELPRDRVEIDEGWLRLFAAPDTT